MFLLDSEWSIPPGSNNYPDTVRLGDVYEGYIPANPEKHREIWSGQIKQALIDELEMSDLEAQSVMSELVDMELEEAFVYLEEKYDWYSARYMYEDSAYYKGTSEEINAYLNEKMKNKTFSFYYSRKFADFAGLFMCFFATIMLAVLFLQDTKKHTYELLHTKPITAGKYVLGKVSAGFAICLIALTIINLLFWALCVIYTKDSGFEVRFWDFIVSTVLYILPNMLMRKAREVEQKYRITSKQYVEGGLQLRVISEIQPELECMSIPATLEDAYIYVTNQYE